LAAFLRSHAPQQRLDVERKQHELLKADIERAQKSAITFCQPEECDRFEQSLFPASSGYSAVISELDGIARKSGIQLADISSKQTEIPKRGMTEVASMPTQWQLQKRDRLFERPAALPESLCPLMAFWAPDSKLLGSERQSINDIMIRGALQAVQKSRSRFCSCH